ncbi:hypothetical protein [Actinomadura fibrosa]|uniref:Uncharacterized protein n=1 Tax=Actinomadura fibrosa TaxID=111802 RepID=A0ABW2XTE7_9ACTN|nr:hypothetical protein [Actinomadura fibrosa]
MTAVGTGRLPRRADAAPAPRSPRVLLAPVTVTPTKPLSPSHLKGLLWTDVMYRATAHLGQVTYRCSQTALHLTEQTLGFWEYLDRVLGDTGYRDRSEQDIGELYVRYREEGRDVPAEALRPYAEAAERYGWVHPASRRVLELWTAHYARLGMHDPGLTLHQPPGFTLEEMLAWLDARGLCLDLRGSGGPVYLDPTRHGMPLRRLVSPDGRPNLLACALRDLLPLAASHDEVVLLHDTDLEPDYRLLARVLAHAGPQVRRVALGRVPIDGRVRTARQGDWRGRSAGDLLDALGTPPTPRGEALLRLAMRLYFIGSLGPGGRRSFQLEELRSRVGRAGRLLDAPPGDDDVAGFLARHREGLHVDPYRLTAGLLARHRPVPAGALVPAVYT